ncbi:dimethylsulfoniopropionate lyase [Marivita sp. S6314]|uniref:dimethylsulfonioproprionate lyase family protein n=1 Tax=Marivita sp. S6314 TaxID=2926406 RepID=UPI001FF2D8E6|nr:dimethylsulfonioproprionate lyase family protein [Marivita sp. S6314]MCK0151580.1 dimethylsulfoniopropionate lyase [Marivita sp. S6314]
MTPRNPALQRFLNSIERAYLARPRPDLHETAVRIVFNCLKSPAPQSNQTPGRLPVCTHLAPLAEPQRFDDPSLRQVMTDFMALEPRLEWRRRVGSRTGASDSFEDGHANVLLVGPGGLEDRTDVWLGASLLAPHVQYPDHRHTPEETYLVMSKGGFRQGHNAWVDVEAGDTFYNVYNIIHSMRSCDEPLFAFWALREKPI